MNRNLSLVCSLVVALLFGGVGTAFGQAGSLAYIDTQRILAEAPGTSDAQAAFEQDMASYQTELESLEAQLDSMQTSLDQQQATLSATALQQRQQELQAKFTEYQQRRLQLEEVAQQRQAELVGPIMQRITQVLEEIRREGNYAMIFDTATGVLATADPALDLTDQVLERLRQTASR